MGISILVVLILLGFLASFFSAALWNLSQEEFNRILKDDYKAAQKLQKLNSQYDDNLSSFQVIELTSYFASGILFGKLLVESNYTLLISSIVFASAVILFVAIRYGVHALGMKYSDEITHKLSLPMYIMYYISFPLYGTVSFISRKIIGKEDDEDSRDEIAALVDSAHEDGSLDQEEYRIIKNVIHFDNIKVGDVMTPRSVVFSVRADKTVREVLEIPEIHMYSRFPVWLGDSIDDEIIGYVMSKDVMIQAIQGKLDVPISELSREIRSVSIDDELDKTLEVFLAGRVHQLIVLDQYGGMQGLVTMEDVLETILGAEIVDEADRFVDMRQLAKQRKAGKTHYVNQDIFKQSK